MKLSTEHQQVADMTRRFANELIRPEAERLDREEVFAGDIYKAMGENGLFGITVPETYGGAGLDVLAYSLVMEELSRGYASVADQCGLVELVTSLLCTHGSAAQKDKWIAPIIRAEQRAAYCITEAGAGSDVSGVKTTAVPRGAGWVLNGAKLWIHNAPVADVAFVLARTNPEAGKRGMSIFVVDCALPGVSRGPKEHKLGQRSSQVGELHFENVELPADALLGVEGRGFHMMMSVLEKGRVGIASLAVGILQAALEASVEQAKIRKQFGQAIAEFQGIQFMLADMAKDTQAARLLVRSAAEMLDAGGDATAAASMAKCFAGDAAVAHSSNAIQIFGGSGYIRGYEVERLYRDAKITQIYEGTNQVQRIIIARKLLNG
ncbi:acyl-CoA dehydrogenase family protein [Variovorax guangxiensis]|uniref:acyl-CoA dehydrogenase family protein n=1 Tax=Variovorax guangxiensis TaxID=1775474 RepID=UPI0028617BA7|nr:acyl-CoA dehydrogenase family protein [Variovorax guangxiensis]MDR6860451.1 alkylation response protein AidB-like acyl-CoA dehydrogenase [Variovorax guangxiensis]